MRNIEEYFDNFFRGTREPSLDNMKYLLKKYNNFHNEMKFIHVAGTNGKGSCVELISNVLQEQGYKVGKFITPHLIKYNERIVINNKKITDKELSDLIDEVEPIIEEYNKSNSNFKVSYFEAITIIALLYYHRNNVDFVVLETGLGGLYDATNVISNPLVSIITSIGYDHIQMLGNTLTQIANHKAGIIKENSNTIVFDQTEEINNVFKNTCKEKNNKLYIISEESIQNFRYDNCYQYFDYEKYKDIEVVLKGKKQIINAAITIECMKILNNLGYLVTEKSIREGIRTVIHKGRMEVVNNCPLIIFDGAHNEPAVENLQSTINMYYKDYERTYIISILKRKNYKKMLQLLLQDKDAKFIFTSGNNPKKYATKEELYNEAIKHTNNTNLYMKYLDVTIEELLKEKDNKSANFVVGSFYTYESVTKIIEKQK